MVVLVMWVTSACAFYGLIALYELSASNKIQNEMESITFHILHQTAGCAIDDWSDPDDNLRGWSISTTLELVIVNSYRIIRIRLYEMHFMKLRRKLIFNFDYDFYYYNFRQRIIIQVLLLAATMYCIMKRAMHLLTISFFCCTYLHQVRGSTFLHSSCA